MKLIIFQTMYWEFGILEKYRHGLGDRKDPSWISSKLEILWESPHCFDTHSQRLFRSAHHVNSEWEKETNSIRTHISFTRFVRRWVEHPWAIEFGRRCDRPSSKDTRPWTTCDSVDARMPTLHERHNISEYLSPKYLIMVSWKTSSVKNACFTPLFWCEWHFLNIGFLAKETNNWVTENSNIEVLTVSR